MVKGRFSDGVPRNAVNSAFSILIDDSHLGVRGLNVLILCRLVRAFLICGLLSAIYGQINFLFFIPQSTSLDVSHQFT